MLWARRTDEVPAASSRSAASSSWPWTSTTSSWSGTLSDRSRPRVTSVLSGASAEPVARDSMASRSTFLPVMSLTASAARGSGHRSSSGTSPARRVFGVLAVASLALRATARRAAMSASSPKPRMALSWS